jgi:hypothetical protein
MGENHMTDNIRKLIAGCSNVTHGGVPATTEHTRLAKVADAYREGLQAMHTNMNLYTCEDYAEAICELEAKAERIAGEV